ncbi:MAG TPA: hypothetical protein VHY32_07075 [Caulobacteraceae bacterium]|jgi:hypothetical protein|nr:hypothetical protein [Caulobacteraceae bacterium]
MKPLFRCSALLAVACAPTLACAASVDPDLLDFRVGPGDGAAVKADANINAILPTFQSGLAVSFAADPQFSNADPFHQAASAAASHESVGLNAAWIAGPSLKLHLSVADKLDQTWRTVGLGLVDPHQISIDERSGRADLTLSPLSPVELDLSADARQRSVADVASGDGLLAQPHSQFDGTDQNAAAGLKWKLASWFNLKAQGRLETGSAQWRGAPAGEAATGASVSYAYVEPALTGALTTPGRGDLSLTFERAVSPLDQGVFSTFAAVEDRSADARITPNREWRYRLNFNQTLADQMRLSAALIEARIESATELGLVGPDLQAPISVSGGQRQEADVSLSAPLAMLGLPSFTLKGAGVWKSSQVRDPITGELRRASGEAPRTGTLDLVQSLADSGATWGLEGRFGGDESLYQASQTTSISVADSLGGFVEYRPGAFAVRLQVDGLYGGERNATDLYYEGSRASGMIARIDHRSDDGQAVRLVLSKAL